MDAFIKYIQNRPIEIVGVVSTEVTGGIGNESINQSFNNETCRLEIVSSVTYDGRETITISIGSGALVECRYRCLTESYSGEEIIHATTVLEIVYQEGTDRSVHAFMKEIITNKSTAARANQFSYECTSTAISKYE